MSESTLKFGPEWLRNLSQGTNVSSPPPSPGLGLHAPKFKLAEFRYGREEMLAIFPKDIKMPPDLKQFTGMHKEQFQLPVTLVALTEEEQKIWSRSVNSDAVLRLMGKGSSGPPAGVSAPRGGRGGGSVDRGRGRGRATYFQRGPSLDDAGENPPPGIFTRQRSYERPNSLTERGAGWEERERRFEKGFASREDEPSASGRKEAARGSLDWRSSNQRDRDRDGEDDGGWRVSGLRSEKWGRTGWRSERGEREHEDSNAEWPNNVKGPHRKANASGRPWTDDHPAGDTLPEWSTEDNRDAESVGTFDATGAFMETKNVDRKVKLKEATVPNDLNTSRDSSHEKQQTDSPSSSPPSSEETETPHQPSPEPKKISSPSESPHSVVKKPEMHKEADTIKVAPGNINNKEAEVNHNTVSSINVSPSATHKKEEIYFEHLEKAAESLVDTWTAEEDENVEVNHISNPSLSQWYYRDPQGIVQGPFSDSEMAEWFRTGYFNMSLLVRRGLDDRFCPLGDLVKQCGCVPFLASNAPVVVPTPPAPSQPPQVPQPIPPAASVLNGLLGPATVPIEHQSDLSVDHDQQLRLLQQQLLQQQLLQQQHLFQQQQQQMYLRQQLQQVLGGLKPADGFSQLSSQQQQQQQQYFLQRLLAQQQHPPGVLPRPSNENGNVSDPLRQFMAQLTTNQAVPLKDDSQALWNMQARTPHSDVGARWTGMHNQPASVWDLDSVAASHEASLGPSRIPPEVLDQEKKLQEEQQKKRLNEEEMLRKQEEERRRRQLEEEERERELREEIRRREEEEERIRREELLCKQREMEERKQKEAEERRLKEQELRRLQEEEMRRREEQEKEERLQQELFQRQEDERLRQQREFTQQEEQRKREEYRKQEEERRKLEEEKIKLEHQREMQCQLKIQQQEALKRLQKQQKSKPQVPAWGGQTAKPNDNSLSLSEIQKLQEEKDRQERLEWEMQQHFIQQQLHQQQQQQAQQAKAASLTWANRGNGAGGLVKSLLEIQREEADKLAQEQQKEQQVKKQQQANNVSLATAGVWSNANNHLLRANTSPSPWNVENSISNSHGSGFWDDSLPVTNGSKAQMPNPNKSPDQRYAALANNTANSNGQTGKSRMIRARKEEETVMKLFEGHTQTVDEFTKWCSQTLRSMQSTIDVPTFVAFLKDVESPYEVYDYVRVYLGEGKEAHNFAKQFLEKRSKYRNQDHKKEENMWGPAPAITPTLSKLQAGEMEGPKVAGGKRKKKRMQKLDNTILGFTVHASMDRVNVGDIDHGEDI